MSSKKLVSVLMSAYNSEDTIKLSIESIINQTYSNIEFLIIDDASTDNTYSICKDYENNFDQIRIFKNDENIGLTKSLNKLINYSTGHYIARQDADDYSQDVRIEKQVAFLEKNSIDGCSTRAKIIDTKKLIPGKSFYIPKRILLKFKNPYIHGSLLIKKKNLKEVNCYDENFYYAQDYKLIYDLLDKNYKILIMKDPLYNLNMNNNISSKFKEEQKYYANCVRKNILPTEIK
tara:strand:+ start:16354 stop:17052 length:699 start_codon:yes stop_codon:yes gene_type:complete